MGKPKTYGPYQCVHPVRRHLGGYSSLWLAKDHLLAVNCTGYTDKYNRYYLRDIQGFMVEDTEWRFYVGIVFGLLGSIAVVACLLGHAPWLVVVIVALLFGAPLIWNHVKGPGCKLYIITQVQSTRLSAVARRAKAEQLIEDLRGLIEAAQADLVPAVPTAEAPGAQAAESEQAQRERAVEVGITMKPAEGTSNEGPAAGEAGASRSEN